MSYNFKIKSKKTGDCLLVTMTADPGVREENGGFPDHLHPFWRLEEGRDEPDEPIKTGKYKEYVADNPVTQAIVSLLSMNEEALKLRCGNTAVDDYRAILISVLERLWD